MSEKRTIVNRMVALQVRLHIRPMFAWISDGRLRLLESWKREGVHSSHAGTERIDAAHRGRTCAPSTHGQARCSRGCTRRLPDIRHGWRGLERHQRLAARFPSWDVDCEYDRLLEEAKKLRLRGEIARVIPDIIVHRRNTKNNLLVIEAKKDNDPRGMGADREKLREFRRQLHYRHAVFLRFRTGENPGIESPVWI